MGRHVDRLKMNNLLEQIAKVDGLGIEGTTDVTNCNCEEEYKELNERVEALEKQVEELKSTLDDMVKSLVGLQSGETQAEPNKSKTKAKNAKVEEK